MMWLVEIGEWSKIYAEMSFSRALCVAYGVILQCKNDQRGLNGLNTRCKLKYDWLEDDLFILERRYEKYLLSLCVVAMAVSLPTTPPPLKAINSSIPKAK